MIIVTMNRKSRGGKSIGSGFSSKEFEVEMPDIIDVNAGRIIDGEEKIEQTAKRILDYTIDVASGIKESSAVRNLQTDFIPWRRGRGK